VSVHCMTSVHPMPRVMVWTPKVPPGPNPLADMDISLTFASPNYYQVPIVGGLFPQLIPGAHLIAGAKDA